MAITSQFQRAGFPLTLELDSKEHPKRSWVRISNIRTLSTERIGKKIGTVSPEELDQIIEGLNEIIGSYQGMLAALGLQYLGAGMFWE
jgi:mRNA interferase MazF